MGSHYDPVRSESEVRKGHGEESTRGTRWLRLDSPDLTENSVEIKSTKKIIVISKILLNLKNKGLLYRFYQSIQMLSLTW